MGLLKAPKRVLIMDDEPTVVAEISRALKSGEVEVVTASSLEAAEEAVSRYQFELVLADITMSGILGKEGLELISFIKNRRPGARIVAMTSTQDYEDLRQDAYKRGADCFWRKPVAAPEVFRLLLQIGVNITQQDRG